MRHATRLDRPDTNGVTLRATLELRASQGSRQAVADLTPPDYPESLTYLLGWSHELVGRSGVGMDGAAPLSWSTLDAWSRLTGRVIDSNDCDALMLLDHAFRHPEEPESKAPVDVKEPVQAVIRPWPSRKPLPERSE